jgi:arylsulfatase A-like enzyme
VAERRGNGLTRRGLLGRAGALGAGAAGAAALGAPRAARAQPAGRLDARNVLLIVTSSLRADFLGVYDDNDDRAETPNLDDLSSSSLRFEHAVPESMPAVSARRALLTGQRSYPFRDWRPTDGYPARVGWNPIYDNQPTLTGVLSAAGVRTAYCTDNPFIVGPNFANFARTVDDFRPDFSQGAYREFNRPLGDSVSTAELSPFLFPALAGSDAVERLRGHVAYNRSNRRGEDDYPAARVMSSGMRALEDLRERQPFFLGVDTFDPGPPFDPPPSYLERFDGYDGEIDPILPFEYPFSRVDDVGLDARTVSRVRDLYAAKVTFVDRWIGRLLDKLDELDLLDTTLVYFVSDQGIALGEHGVVGATLETAYHEVNEVPHMIRDPGGRRGGDTSDYFAMTHDVAPTLLAHMEVTAPGKMQGEDLTALFDDDPAALRRPHFTTGFERQVLVGDHRWLTTAAINGNNKRLYDTDEDDGSAEREDGIRELREERGKANEMWALAVNDAGGTVPLFGEEGAIRPPPERKEDADADFDADDPEDLDAGDDDAENP